MAFELDDVLTNEVTTLSDEELNDLKNTVEDLEDLRVVYRKLTNGFSLVVSF